MEEDKTFKVIGYKVWVTRGCELGFTGRVRTAMLFSSGNSGKPSTGSLLPYSGFGAMQFGGIAIKKYSKTFSVLMSRGSEWKNS